LNGAKNIASVQEASGKLPALVGFDLSGWNSPTWGPSYTKVVQNAIDGAKEWSERGGIVTMQFHWKNPGKPDGKAWVQPPKGTGPFDVGAAVRPGTTEHKQVMDDLKKHADYLEQLRDARIPVLWRPLHEIDGGWFWWTDKETPENTAALYRQIFDYFVKERKLDNLIWVYNAALVCGREAENIELRKRYYPGAEYVDISGIDIYPNERAGWKSYREDAYDRAYRIMQEVSPGKMLALSEGDAIPNPQIMAEDGPRWLYCVPWWGAGKRHPADWIKTSYNHELMITLEDLPKFSERGEQ
ncbi:MAG: glycosyl hydrolase, partial [Planctomycetota bacterium]